MIIPTNREAATTVLIDSPDSNTTYVGEAKLGTATSEAAWQIQKISKSGTQTLIQFASGSKRFNQIWDNRASLTYSN